MNLLPDGGWSSAAPTGPSSQQTSPPTPLPRRPRGAGEGLEPDGAWALSNVGAMDLGLTVDGLPWLWLGRPPKTNPAAEPPARTGATGSVIPPQRSNPHEPHAGLGPRSSPRALLGVPNSAGAVWSRSCAANVARRTSRSGLASNAPVADALCVGHGLVMRHRPTAWKANPKKGNEARRVMTLRASKKPWSRSGCSVRWPRSSRGSRRRRS